MRLTPFAKFMLALVIIGTVGYGLYLNRDKLPIGGGPVGLASRAPATAAPTGGQVAPAADGKLIIEGSTAMIKLLDGWAAAFKKEQPGVEVARGYGGTTVGINNLIGQAVDLAAASRKPKQKEEAMAKKAGVELRLHAVALDAVAVIVHPDNPVADLTLDQLKGIYSGAVTNWKQVGGKPMAIKLFGREKKAGMYELFKEKVLVGADYAPSMTPVGTTTQMLQEIRKHPGAIGTATVAQSATQRTVKVIALKKDADSPAIQPNLADKVNDRVIRNGAYPLTREVFLITRGEPEGLAKAFIDLALSDAGQQVVVANEFTSIKGE